jgi:hypothetical protein
MIVVYNGKHLIESKFLHNLLIAALRHHDWMYDIDVYLVAISSNQEYIRKVCL